MASVILSAILVVASLNSLNSTGFRRAPEDARLVRSFAEPIRTLIVENIAGPTEIRITAEPGVSVSASRSSSHDNSRIEAEVLFERPGSDTLKVVANPDSLFRPISLTILVSATVNVSVKGGSERVSIKGQPASLALETQTGSVTIYLPDKSNIDLSLRSTRGVVESRLPVNLFGRADSHVLDGRIGSGGSPLIARSQRGNITVRREPGAEEAAISRLLENQDNRNPGEVSQTGPSDVKTVQTVNETATPADIGLTGDVIKLEARLVNLNVKVTDAAGKTLPALRKEDFVVFEDDVRQDVAHFEPVNAPLNLALLLDLSGSTEKKIKIMKKAAQKFVDSLKPNDRIAIAGFTRRFFIISNFTTDHKLLKERIDDLKNRHSGTAFYDAMWTTLDLLDEANTTRKAIVVLTDGVDNSLSDPEESEYDPKHEFSELLARMIEADATIYPIYLDTEYETIGSRGGRGHEAYVTARKQLQMMADQTGAVMFKAEKAEDLEGVYQQVAAELHSLYSMAYTPKSIRNDGKWRKISIGVELPGAKARTKRGYFAK